MAIGLGSSIGPRRATLELVLRKLASHPGLGFVRASRWVLTPPLRGGVARNPFLNGVALFRVELSPERLLAVCVALEDDLGRRRGRHWADRPIDLDILLWGERVVELPGLKVPHPQIGARRFVLEPLLEVWGDAVDPRSGARYADLPRPPGPAPVPVGVVALHPPGSRASRPRSLATRGLAAYQ